MGAYALFFCNGTYLMAHDVEFKRKKMSVFFLIGTQQTLSHIVSSQVRV